VTSKAFRHTGADVIGSRALQLSGRSRTKQDSEECSGLSPLSLPLPRFLPLGLLPISLSLLATLVIPSLLRHPPRSPPYRNSSLSLFSRPTFSTPTRLVPSSLLCLVPRPSPCQDNRRQVSLGPSLTANARAGGPGSVVPAALCAECEPTGRLEPPLFRHVLASAPERPEVSPAAGSTPVSPPARSECAVRLSLCSSALEPLSSDQGPLSVGLSRARLSGGLLFERAFERLSRIRPSCSLSSLACARARKSTRSPSIASAAHAIPHAIPTSPIVSRTP